MANNTQRFYFVLPAEDGTASLGCIANDKYDPRVSIFDQLDKCMFLDNMPLNEMLETGASLITAAVAAGRAYTNKVRVSAVQRMAVNAIHQPANPEELAKIAAFFDGVSLDPGASPVQVFEGLQKQEEAEKAAEEGQAG